MRNVGTPRFQGGRPRGRSVRGLLAAVLAAALCTGCGAATAGSPGEQRSSRPVRTPMPLPAQAAGGACELLDYETVRIALGLLFSVAAASTGAGTSSCVLQGESSPYPDLRLTVTDTKADPAAFKTSVQPRGAQPVSALGKAAYSVTGGPDARAGAGPVAEIGWLSGKGRIYVLRVALASGTEPAEAGSLVPKLVAMGRNIDRSAI